MWCANRLHQQVQWEKASSTVHENSFCYTRVTRWFMKCQTLLPLKNSGLHICLSCLFQSSWWHTVPISPGMVLWTCGKWMEGRFPPLRRDTELWMSNQERVGTWVAALCHCDAHFITPRPGRASSAGQGELSFRDSVSVLTVSKWKCFSHLFFRNYFSSENIQINSLNPSCIFYKTRMSLAYLLCSLFMTFGSMSSFRFCCSVCFFLRGAHRKLKKEHSYILEEKALF